MRRIRVKVTLTLVVWTPSPTKKNKKRPISAQLTPLHISGATQQQQRPLTKDDVLTPVQL